MKKINIAEMLKYSDRGGRLYSPLCGECILIGINTFNGKMSICVATKNHGRYEFNEFGQYYDITNSECLLFPSKENRDWSTFQRPFKDGDVAISNSGDIHLLRTENSSYCAYRESWRRLPVFDSTITTSVEIVRLATEKEKEMLFQAIKDAGYKWNAETKALEKLEVNKFDITTLKPFESKVLVRNFGAWEPAFWGYYSKEYIFPFVVVGGNTFNKCIPYKGNEHLLGTSDDCDDYYKTWE
jgi:hypothetical protein